MQRSADTKCLTLLRALAVAGLLAFSACVPDAEFDDRHLKPIPAPTLRLMGSKGMSPSSPIFMRIFKRENELEIWKQGSDRKYALLKTYPMCRWSGQLGPKKKQGDRQSPEGVYWVHEGLMNPRSSYHLSFNLGYPNQLEQALGRTGDFLMVHGACSSMGCYAMTDTAMQEIYAIAREAFAGGQKAFQVQALPFRMTPENMVLHRENAHMPFWRDLKEAYDIFEATGKEPTVAYCDYRYQFDVTPVDPNAELRADAACPALIRNTDPERLAYQMRDAEAYQLLMAEGLPALTVSYQDGSMHPSFRAMMRQLGPIKMSKKTSLSEVPISQPEAAYVDPYEAVSLGVGVK